MTGANRNDSQEALPLVDAIPPLQGVRGRRRCRPECAEWGTAENNRSAKYYDLTSRGRKQLAAEAKDWARISGVIGKLLQLESR